MADENGKDRKPTERVILRSAKVLVIPDGATPEQIQAAASALYPKGRAKPPMVTAWTEEARVVAATKTAAIEAHAGKPGTPDAKLGVFRAPTLTAWKDATVYAAPPLPLVERSVIE